MGVLQVHLINVLQHHVAANPHTKSTNLGHESHCRLLRSMSTTSISYYSMVGTATRIFLFLSFIRRAFQCDTMHHGGYSREALLSLNHDRPPRQAVRRAVFYYLLRRRQSARARIMFTSVHVPARLRRSSVSVSGRRLPFCQPWSSWFTVSR